MVLPFKNILNSSERLRNLKKNLDLKIFQDHISKGEISFLEGGPDLFIIYPKLKAKIAQS